MRRIAWALIGVGVLGGCRDRKGEVLQRVAITASPADSDPMALRVTFRVEAFVNRPAGRDACEVVLTASDAERLAVPHVPLGAWVALGGVVPKPGETEPVEAKARCASGPLVLPVAGGPAPPLILEVSIIPGWDPAPMDPGPAATMMASLIVTVRHFEGFSPDGKPLYGDPKKNVRAVRLGEGEEFAWPIALSESMPRELLGATELFVRVRASQSGRPQATQFGVVEVEGAAAGSDIRIDGSLAAHCGEDGKGRLAHVPVGDHHLAIQRGSVSVERRIVVVRGRTVVVQAEDVPDVSPSRPLFSPIGPNAQGIPEFQRLVDGATMVQIPGGKFTMGNLDTEGKPLPHPVNVSSFLIDKLPVTWGLFKKYAAATGRPLPPKPYWGTYDDHPVAFVRWDEGRAYCEWAGGRLPTEAEREKGARGTDGRKYPWGNEEPSPDRAVFRRNWGLEGNDRVGIRLQGASPYGVLDAGGNMWEWCQDWYDADYFKSSPVDNPMGPPTARARVVKGGSWDSRPSVLSASSRNFGYVGYREGDFGFRCAADLPKSW